MRRIATLLLCAAALLAGCGSDDDEATPAAEGTPTPAQEQDRSGYGY